MINHYTARHNLFVNRLTDVIRLICNVIGNVDENRIITITSREGMNDGSFKTRIRPDIWYWIDTWTKDSIPERQRILHSIEMKSRWGGIYDGTVGITGGNMRYARKNKA
jgi:hypothetical protein